MKPIAKLMTLLIAACLSFSALALDLKDAKSDGWVGEQFDGYLGVVKTSPEVVALVDEINAKRRQAYQRIAQKNNLSLEQVALLAGEKAIEKTPAGQYVRGKEGSWQKK